MPTDNLDNHKSLPIAFRGYDREPVDSLLAQAEKSNSSLIAERDNLREDLEHAKKRLSEATSELNNTTPPRSKQSQRQLAEQQAWRRSLAGSRPSSTNHRHDWPTRPGVFQRSKRNSRLINNSSWRSRMLSSQRSCLRHKVAIKAKH